MMIHNLHRYKFTGWIWEFQILRQLQVRLLFDSLIIVGFSDAKLVGGCLFWSGIVDDCMTKPRAFATKPMGILVATRCHIWLEVQLHEYVHQVGGKAWETKSALPWNHKRKDCLVNRPHPLQIQLPGGIIQGSAPRVRSAGWHPGTGAMSDISHVVLRINLPFGEVLYQLFMVILGIVYGIVLTTFLGLLERQYINSNIYI
jgi:hypothetical protein